MNAEEGTEEKELFYTVGMWIGVATVETSMQFSQETKNRTTVWSSSALLGIYPEKIKKYMHHNIHSSIIYNINS